jgi:hypothetical protein
LPLALSQRTSYSVPIHDWHHYIEHNGVEIVLT